MPTLIAGVVAVVVLYLLLQTFRAANPAVLARGAKISGGILVLAVAIFKGILRLLSLTSSQRSAGRTSRVRSRYLEMILDHDSGALTGTVVSGPNAGRSLETFDLPALLGMFTELDNESVPLLESYLDRRFSGWRQHAQGDAAGGQRRAAPGGKMTDQEAYQILGLKPGAGRDEIGRAHRALMKKLHPDQGGTTYLAARVNEAKEVLLRTHHR